MTTTTDFITRLERAEAGQERELLLEVFIACKGERPPSNYDGLAWRRNEPDFNPEWTKYIGSESRFKAMLDAHAWTSAAEMLMGDDPEYDTNTLYHIARASVYSIDGQFHGEHPGGAKFVWAALAAAAVKARG